MARERDAGERVSERQRLQKERKGLYRNRKRETATG
jgi:hypothetical protein